MFVRTGDVTAEDALAILGELSAVRDWEANSYVQRARAQLADS